jgi:hypothetical protein
VIKNVIIMHVGNNYKTIITISNRRGMKNLIVHAVTSDNFPFGRGAPLQEDRKFVMMGGANFHLVKILALVCRSSVRMLLVLRVQKICSHQKYMAGTLELDTPSQQ